MDSVKLINVHVFIAKIRIVYGIIFIAYEMMWSHLYLRHVSSYQLRRQECLVIGIIMLFVIADFLFAIKKYFNNLRIVVVVRSILAMFAGVILVSGIERSYISALSMFLFLTLIVQILYLTNIPRFRSKFSLFLIVYFPIFVTSFIRIGLVDNFEFAVRTIVFNFIFFSVMLVLILIISHIFAENSLEKKRLSTELLRMKRLSRTVIQKEEQELENAYEKLSRENSEMLIENLIQQYISSSLEISNLMKLILESLTEALVVNVCSIIVKGDEKESFQYDTRCMNQLVDLSYYNANLIDGKLMEKFKDVKDPYIDNQVNMEEYEFLKDMGIQSLLIYPLRNEKELLGLLIIGKDVRDYFLDNMTFFERVSTQFSIALSNARIYSKMEDLAMKDGLTGIYNRAYMTQKINEHISGSVLSNSAWAILIFDIDYFKKVNDRYGHLFGDEVIRVCANQAKETAELYHGVAARYGGEEFVIIVKGQSIESLREIANDLHSKIKQKKVDYRGDSVYVDVSVGVAAYPFTCNNPAELIDRADKAMYYSKQQGRGCITFDGEYVAI